MHFFVEAVLFEQADAVGQVSDFLGGVGAGTEMGVGAWMRALGRKVSLALIASGMSAVVCTSPNSSSMITSNRHI